MKPIDTFPMFKAAVIAHIQSLEAHQDTLFNQGHVFWHCDAVDSNDRTGEILPFRYYQTNRTVSMSTCTTCIKLIELRKQIRKLQASIGIELTPLRTRITTDTLLKRISVTDKNEYNPNYAYL